MSVHVGSRYQAHPLTDDWPRPVRYERLQFAIATVAYALALLCLFVGILVVGLVAGAVVGVDMAVAP